MKRILLPAVCFCILFSISPRAAVTDNYAYAWPLQTQGAGAAWQVELTPEVYAAMTTADLRDIEVVNAAGDSVPTAAYRPPAAAATVESLVDVPVFDLPAASGADAAAGSDAIRLQIERGSDGRLRRVDASVGAASAGPAATAPAKDLLLDASTIRDAFAALRIDWSGSADANAQFAVDVSDDLQQWRPLVARATVLHLTQDGNLLDRHEIALNRSRAAYLRVRRSDGGTPLPELKLRLRTIVASTARQTARQWLTATVDGADAKHVDATLPAGDGARPIAWRYHLPAALTIDALKLDLADDNSLARVHVLSHPRDTRPDAWAQRAAIVAFRLHQDDAVVGNDEIAAAPTAAAREWRVESATPLDHAPTLSVAYLPDRLVFLAQGEGPYRLVAGSARTRRGDYPVDAALASLRATQGSEWQPPLAALAARTTLQGDAAFVPAAAPEKPHDWKSWLLWAVLVGAAAIVGGLAMSLLKGSGQGPGAKGG